MGKCEGLATPQGGGEFIRIVNGFCAALLMVILVWVGVWWITEASSVKVEVVTPDTYLVQPGDTLWHIAKQYYPRRDPRAVIWEIRELNQMASATIYAYQELKLPK